MSIQPLHADDYLYRNVTPGEVRLAKDLMRNGLDLHEAAHCLGLRSRDVDKALWINLGGEPKGWTR